MKTNNGIQTFITCGQCVHELPAGRRMEDWARLNVGMLKDRSVQVWCVRHNCNVAIIDRKTGIPRQFSTSKCIVQEIPEGELDRLENDLEFIAILRLCRFLNQIHFCIYSLLYAGLDVPPTSEMHPEGHRQYYNSIFFLVAVLHEAFRVIPDLGKEFHEFPAYRDGFALFFKREDVKRLTEILRGMRNSLIFHVDAKAVKDFLEDSSLAGYEFVAASEDEGTRLPFPNTVYFPLADEVALNKFIGSSGTIVEGSDTYYELEGMLMSVAEHFSICGQRLILDYAKLKGWEFAAYKSYADYYSTLDFD